MWALILVIAIVILVGGILMYTLVAEAIEGEEAFLIVAGIFLVVYILAAIFLFKVIKVKQGPADISSFWGPNAFVKTQDIKTK